MNGEGAQDRKLREALETLAGFRKSKGGRALTVSEIEAVNERVASATMGILKVEGLISRLTADISEARRQIGSLNILDQSDFAAASHAHVFSDVEGLQSLADQAARMVSNANGISVRFPDAMWQVCISPTYTLDVNTASGSLFQSTEQAWVFPQSFSDIPMISATNMNNTGVWGTARSSVATGGAGRLWAAVSWTGRTLKMRAEGPYTP